ncbi:putative zinc ribbon protein [Yersinia rohdei]
MKYAAHYYGERYCKSCQIGIHSANTSLLGF